MYEPIKDVPKGAMLFFAILVLITCAIQLSIYSKHRAVGFSANELSKDEDFPCHVFAPHKHCCVREYQKHLINGNFVKNSAPSSFFSKYRLLNKEEMVKSECSFGNGEKRVLDNKSVWIFSKDLRTETSNDGFESIASANVNAGVRYVYFYIDKTISAELVNQNKQKILSTIDDEKKDYVSFVPISGVATTDTDVRMLPYILGSITFISPNLTTTNIEAYFSLRKNIDDTEPVYFKMPTCMRKAFYNYFREKSPQQNQSRYPKLN